MDITKEGVSKYANILVLHPHIDLEPRAQEFRGLLLVLRCAGVHSTGARIRAGVRMHGAGVWW